MTFKIISAWRVLSPQSTSTYLKYWLVDWLFPIESYTDCHIKLVQYDPTENHNNRRLFAVVYLCVSNRPDNSALTSKCKDLKIIGNFKKKKNSVCFTSLLMCCFSVVMKTNGNKKKRANIKCCNANNILVVVPYIKQL